MFYTEEKRLYPSFIPGKLNFKVVGINLDTPIFIAVIERVKDSVEELSIPKMVMVSDTPSLADLCESLPIKKIYGVMPSRLTNSRETEPLEIKQVLIATYPTRKPRGLVFRYLLANGESIFDGYTRAPKVVQKLKFESYISFE